MITEERKNELRKLAQEPLCPSIKETELNEFRGKTKQFKKASDITTSKELAEAHILSMKNGTPSVSVQPAPSVTLFSAE